MTENLKIEVSMVDVEGGVVDTSLATKEELNEAVQSKADLIEGKVPVIQLPPFQEINGVSEAINGVETKIREEVETKLSNSNNGLESRIDEKLVLKADLVNGRVPASQSPAFKDVEGAKGALDGLKEALTAKYDQKVLELSEGKADLVDGKIPTSQLPIDGIVTPLEFQLKSQELDTKFSNLEDSVEAEKNAFITQAGNLIAGKANAVDVYDKVNVDNKLSGKVDVLKYEGEIAKKAEKVYVDNALTGLSNGSSKFYPTLALANADIANLAVNQPVNVGEAANGGLWYKATAGATTLTKSAYDPLTQAKSYADENAIFNPASVNSSGVDFNELTKFGFHRFFRITDWNNSNNRPALENQWAMVLVLPLTTGAVGQFVFCFNSGKTAFRYGSGSPLVWQPWVINSDDAVIQQMITTSLANNPMLTPKNISGTTGVDFNTLNTHGFNRTLSANAWDLSTNKPPEVGQWAIVMVIPISATVVFQFVFCINANVLYFRSSTNATTWAVWKKLSGDTAVLQSALTAAQAAADTRVNELRNQLPGAVDSHLSPKFEIGGKNFFDPLSIVLGKTISSTGVITDNKPNGVLSGVIDVVGKTNLYVSGLQASSGAYRAIVFWREDGTVAQVQSIGPNLTEKLFAIPQNGAVKAQMCIKENNDTFTLDTSAIQFEFSATKTEYEPFKRGPLKSIYGVEISSPIKPGERFIKSRAFGASYLLFGDSITETSNVDAGLFDQTAYRKNWPTWAVETLQMGTFRNYAKSGAAFKDRSLEPRYQYLYNQVIDAIANNENPDVIVVACGTNDGMGNVGTYETAMSKTSLEALNQLVTLEAARWVFWKLRLQYPDAVCFFANPLQRMANTTEELAPLVDGLSKIAQRHGFILIDQNRESGIIRELEVLSGAGKYLADGLHPNDLGRQRQANLIVSKIVSYMSY